MFYLNFFEELERGKEKKKNIKIRISDHESFY